MPGLLTFMRLMVIVGLAWVHGPVMGSSDDKLDRLIVSSGAAQRLQHYSESAGKPSVGSSTARHEAVDDAFAAGALEVDGQLVAVDARHAAGTELGVHHAVADVVGRRLGG